MQPLGDARDRGGAGAGQPRNLGVVHASVEQPDHCPSLGHVVQFAESAQVAEEGRDLIDRLEAKNRLEHSRPTASLRQASIALMTMSSFSRPLGAC
jgi:hypothetical protein